MTDDKQGTDISGIGGGTGNREGANESAGHSENHSDQGSHASKSQTALQESNRKLGPVFSTARHDINNQLTILAGYLSLLERCSPDTKTSDIIRILEGATARIERILTFTRDYQNIGENAPSWQVLGETIHLGITAIETGSVRIIPDPSCNEVEVYADPLLARVFSGLIDNTLRHGEKVSEIQIKCPVEDNLLTIIYKDNGIGISDRIRPVLFEQGKGKNGGNGLFLIREILASTGMSITEKGVAGKGACFEIIVPSGSFRMTSRK